MTSEAETIRIDEIVAHMESLVFTADGGVRISVCEAVG